MKPVAPQLKEVHEGIVFKEANLNSSDIPRRKLMLMSP